MDTTLSIIKMTETLSKICDKISYLVSNCMKQLAQQNIERTYTELYLVRVLSSISIFSPKNFKPDFDKKFHKN